MRLFVDTVGWSISLGGGIRIDDAQKFRHGA